MSDFCHLHVHTEYSLLDGACRIRDLVRLAKEEGQTSLAITDHGVMYGAVAFYDAMVKEGLHPIIGCEVYVASRTRFDKVHAYDSERYHLILLCKNETGYRNLMRLVSLSWTEGFYTKPRVDRELLEACHEGLIALSGCLFGEVARNILSRDMKAAKETALWYMSVFGKDNYFLEVQNHGSVEELEVIEGAMKLHRELGIPLVATNDVHYCKKEDAEVQKVLISIGTNKTVDEPNDLAFTAPEFYLKTEQEMYEAFAMCPEAVAASGEIAARCQFQFTFGQTKLPHFEIPDTDHRAYLRDACNNGLAERLGETPSAAYLERLDSELSVIDRMGFNDYFLIVADFIRFAKSRGIPVGPGRGSAAGSLCAYALGITGIDPIVHRLLFERFLNPERISMPDIDIDFCYVRRAEVIDYVTRKYGESRVAQIVTFDTMAAKGAVRDVARALGLPYSTGDIVAKQLSREFPDIESALSKNPALKKMYDEDENIHRLLDTAMRVEGMPRHASTHAAGVVITRDEVMSYVPLAKNGDQPVTQYTMTEIERLGLLKMDFLGLRTLTVIDDAQKEIRKTLPEFDVERIPLDDEAVFRELGKGNTVGVFQCESAGMTNLIVNMKPACFNDIAAALALYRPGPMFFIDDYLRNRKDPSLIRYRTPMLKEILDETNGCMVYQEQVMQVFRTLAGYSYGRADVVRRAMSKKKHDVMEQERSVFIYGKTDEDGRVVCEGCVRRGIDEKTADAVFSDMTSFASYGFNKSHTVAYGLIAYRTAYLRVHFPQQFFAALLTSVIGETGKTVIYVNECLRLGIPVLPPHVNESFEGFAAQGEAVTFALLGVKNLGRALIRKIVDERNAGGVYESFWDFVKRNYGTELNRRALEALIKSGALDGLGLNRREMLLNLETVMECAARESELYAGGQLDFFSVSAEFTPGEPEWKHCEELPENEKLIFEKEIAGLYFSGHPLREYRELSRSLGCPRTVDLTEQLENGMERSLDGKPIRFLGIITSMKKKVTKRDEIMAFCNIEDEFGSLEMICFPKLLAVNAALLTVDSVVVATGRLSVKDDEIKLIPDSVVSAKDAALTPMSPLPLRSDSRITSEGKPSKAPQGESSAPAAGKSKRVGLFLRLSAEQEESVLGKVQNLLRIFEGSVPVYLYYPDTKRYVPMGNDFLTSPNPPMLAELERILGQGNVVWQQ